MQFSREASSDPDPKDLQSALQSYTKAQDLIPKTEFSSREDAAAFLSQIHMNLGITHTNLKNERKAVNYLKLALDYAKKQGNSGLEADAYRNLAICCELTDVERAIKVC